MQLLEIKLEQNWFNTESKREHGFLDMIVDRRDMSKKVAMLIAKLQKLPQPTID